MTIRPRRSVLYMPGSNARALEKAKTLPVDGVILDLEDAVAPDTKASARGQVVAAVKAGGFGAREVFIRINGLGTPWTADDLTAAAAAAPDLSARRARIRHRHSRRRLQRQFRRRRLCAGMRAGARLRFRRQDADPSGPDRAVQRGILADAG